LEMLSGKEHEILTGVTMIDVKNGKSVSFHQATKVFMKKYGAETIAAYIKTGEPMDKAGAYALQERGAVLIDRIEGDFFNAMGLPLGRLSEELEKFSIKVL
ncbi:MAG TPA: Maf family protein, partial [Patescibacteria group bacterium]|nr:Maf family protein [Patescibacteria group bacterium]